MSVHVHQWENSMKVNRSFPRLSVHLVSRRLSVKNLTVIRGHNITLE